MNDTLSAAEIQKLTGYSPLRPGLQLAELHRQGFYRARRARVTGAVILERPHYDAVSSGVTAPQPRRTPQLRAV